MESVRTPSERGCGQVAAKHQIPKWLGGVGGSLIFTSTFAGYTAAFAAMASYAATQSGLIGRGQALVRERLRRERPQDRPRRRVAGFRRSGPHPGDSVDGSCICISRRSIPAHSVRRIDEIFSRLRLGYDGSMHTKWIHGIMGLLVGLGIGCSSMSTSGSDDLGTATDGMSMNPGGDGGGGPQDMPLSVTEDQACTQLAQAVCAKISQCTSFSFNVSYGNMATCVARQKLSCIGQTTLNGATIKPANIASCANATTQESCEDFDAGNSPAACRPAGTLANGAPCGHAVQCVSGYCAGVGAGSCGVCTARAGQGSPCNAMTYCDYGLYCSGSGASRTCAKYGTQGSACSVANGVLCVGTLACINGTCSPPLAAGATCNQTRDLLYGGCDGYQGVLCAAGTSRCAAVPYAMAGQGCPAGTYCNGASCFNGICVAPAADNASCNTTSGPLCLPVASCTGGKCTVLDPSTCR